VLINNFLSTNGTKKHEKRAGWGLESMPLSLGMLKERGHPARPAPHATLYRLNLKGLAFADFKNPKLG